MKKLTEKLLGALERLSTQQLVLLGGVLVVAMIVMIIVAFTSGEDGRSEEKVAMPTKVNVVVAKHAIPERSQIKEDMVQVIEVASELAPPGAYSEISEVTGKYASYTIAAGDAVTSGKLLNSQGDLGFAGMIPSNMRAISLTVDAASGIGGFAHPGDRVDVNIVRGTGKVTTGELLLQNVLLLAVNESAEDPQAKAANAEIKAEEAKKEGKKADVKEETSNTKAGAPPTIVTLAVTPEDALLLATSSKEGALYLTLRPYNPQNVVVDDVAYLSPGAIAEAAQKVEEDAQRQREQAAVAAIPENPPMTTPAEQKGPTVAVIRGTKIEEDPLK